MTNSKTHSSWHLLNRRLPDEQGSILATVLVVLSLLLILFVAVSAFMVGRYSYHYKNRNRMIAATLAESGINRVRAQFTGLNPDNNEDRWLAPNGGTVETQLSAWGPYLLAISRGQFANQVETHSALLGSVHDSLFAAAIAVGDERYPLMVAGNSLITGDIITGSLGMQAGRIRGEAPSHDEFHQGRIVIESSVNIPEVDSVVLAGYFYQQDERRLSVSKVLPGSQVWKSNDTLPLQPGRSTRVENNLRIETNRSNRFISVTSLFVDGYVEIAGNARLTGLLEIVADGPIYVKDSAIIDEVLLYSSDSIVIEDRVVFSGVAISRTGIVVRDETTLKHPSLLLLYPDADDEDAEAIVLSSRRKLAGVCYVPSRTDEAGSRIGSIQIMPDASFEGYVLSQANAELHGQVNGSVLAEQFRYESPPTTYVNWVKDLKVFRNRLDYYPGLPVMIIDGSPQNLRIIRLDLEKP